jgi:KaiC/GvpD/RAD55 family RecA-like ATPase
VPEILEHETYTGPRYATRLAPLDELLTPYHLPASLAKTDETRYGLIPGKIVALVGQPHKGKTGIAAQVSQVMANHGARVYALLDDEPRREFAARLAQLEGFPPEEVALAPQYPDTLTSIRDRFSSLHIKLFPDSEKDKPRPTIEDVGEALLAEPARLHVLVIDSLHKAVCRAENSEDGERERIEKRCSALRVLREKGVLVLTTVEANRASYASADPTRKTVPLAAAAESRAVEYAADILLMVSGTEAELFKVEVPKNRLTGRLGNFTLTLDRPRARFQALSESEAEARGEESRLVTAEKQEARADVRVRSLLFRFPEGLPKSKVPKKAGIAREAGLEAIDRLVERGDAEVFDGDPPPSGGRTPVMVRLTAAGRVFSTVLDGSGDSSRTIVRRSSDGSPSFLGEPEPSTAPASLLADEEKPRTIDPRGMEVGASAMDNPFDAPGAAEKAAKRGRP